MIDNKISKKPSDPFFTKQFNHYLKEKWLDKGRTKLEFRDAIEVAYKKAHPDDKDCDGKPTKDSITQWSQGAYPRKYINCIIQVLDLESSVFSSEGNPEYDERMRHELDQVRFEYAEKIGLDKNFMLFILHNYSTQDWGNMGQYHYLEKHKADSYFPGEKDPFGIVYEGISEETFAVLQCRFKGIPKDGKYWMFLPTKGDLDFMLLLQKRVTKHIQVALDDLIVMIEKEMFQKIEEKRKGKNRQ